MSPQKDDWKYQGTLSSNDRDKSIVDTILKPEVRAQSEAVEETPMSTATSHSIQESAS